MDIPETVDALAGTWAGTEEVCAGLAPQEWQAPTGCPGWRVHDQVAHLCGVESALLGRAQPEVTVPDYPWLTDDLHRLMEGAVEYRRGWAPPRVLAEFREVTAARLDALRAPGLGPDTAVVGPFGRPSTLRRLLGLRVFDCWFHEQDIREAVGRPGGLDSPAACVSRDRMRAVLPQVAGDAGLGPAEVLRIAADGGAGLDAAVVASPDSAAGFAVLDPQATEATVTLRMSFRVFMRLAGGRLDPAVAPVEVAGDGAVAARVLQALNVTP